MIILLIALVIAQIAAAACYIIFTKSGYNTKTLITKTAASCIFLLTGIAAGVYSGNLHSTYATLLLIAFACSVIGDFFLHGNPPTVKIIIGGLGFLSAHVLLITSFICTVSGFGKRSFMTVKEILVMLSLFALFAVLYFTLKLNAGKLLVPIIIYALVLCFMFTKAFILGISFLGLGSKAAGVLIILGAGFFVASDSMLGISFLGNKTYKKQSVCMGIYYLAQTLLALSIATI